MLARVSNTPTVVTNVLAGAALAGAAALSSEVVWTAVAIVFFYTAGMVLNDVFDFEIDRRERPTRPLPSGVIPRNAALGASLALLAAGAVVLALLSGRALLAGAVLIGVILLYDLWHKSNPLSPLLMAAARVLVYVVAALAVADAVPAEVLAWAIALGLYIVGLTAIAKRETGSALVANWPAALLFLPALLLVVLGAPWWGFVLVFLFATWTLYAATFVYRTSGHRDVGGSVRRLLAGVALLDALALASAGWGAGALIALAAFVLCLFLQNYVPAT